MDTEDPEAAESEQLEHAPAVTTTEIAKVRARLKHDEVARQ